MEKTYHIERARFHTKDAGVFVLQIWFLNDNQGKGEFEASMGKHKIPFSVTTQSGMDVRQKYQRYKCDTELEYFLWIKLPSKWEDLQFLNVYRKTEKGSVKIYSLSGRELKKKKQIVPCWVEKVKETADGKLLVPGWVMTDGLQMRVQLFQNRDKLKFETRFHVRSDVKREFPEASEGDAKGFEFLLDKKAERYGKIVVVLRDGDKSKVVKINVKQQLSDRESPLRYVRLGVDYLQRNGFKSFVRRSVDKIIGSESISYQIWRKRNIPGEKELAAMRKQQFPWMPKFSILVPLYRTPEKYLEELIRSIKEQAYENWELCLSDGSGSNSPLEGILSHLMKEDKRIKVTASQQPLQISENTNKAWEIAEGDFLVFADHDDLLAPEALYECVKAVNRNLDLDVLYSDEDKVDMGGKKYFQPHFKPDFNPDLLCSMNYISHLFVVRKSLADRAGQLLEEYNGAQDYDFTLRCVENTDKIYHIPKVLYHWRAHMDSTAENPQSKLYAFEAGQRAVQAYYDRQGIPALVKQGEYPGLYRSYYTVKEEPLVSIIIPNKDHVRDLKICLDSIENNSDYRNYEYLIVENNSTDPDTFAFYERIQKENPKVHVCKYQGDFNFSAIINFGASKARGEYFLLLNNDTEMIGKTVLRELIGYCMREDVGICGARLYYGDDTIQHAGVVIGFGGIAGHTFIGSRRTDNGYFSRIICAQDYSAVTAACMMVKRSIFEAVGGFSEELKVAFNDIDFCMKVRACGKLVVYNPYAQLYHYESKSRGQEDTQEKVERFNREMTLFTEKWSEILKNGDPYYNPNLTLDKADFSLRV